MFRMDGEDHHMIVSGDVETIVIKPESIEFLFETDDPIWSEEDLSEDSDIELTNSNYDECCFVTKTGEIVTINNEDVIKTPFYLESYFIDHDFRRSLEMSQHVIEIDRITCYECDIVFCNEDRLLEHLMTHIDIYRMGCNICDKDLSLEEKFQLHMMAVTWQSVYYCDFCRKSCAGVVRSKSQPPPQGKFYMCHDCEYQTKQIMNIQNGIHMQQNIKTKPIHSPESPVLLQIPALVPIQQELPSQASHTEVLQDHKQKPNNEAKYEEFEKCSTHNTTLEEQDCYKPCKTLQNLSKLPPKKKENKKHMTSKPKVQIVSESMKQALKLTTRSRTRTQNKLASSYNCRYCPSSFAEDFNLMTHLRERHEFHKLRYVCKMCGKDFKQQRCYENHMSFHQLAKNHMCFVCSLAFLSKCELEQHAKVHDKSEIINAYCDNVALDLRKKKSRAA
ncbi:zinc finger protein 135-like [Phymastichus coffea]|uniref:zinc finger protein 135-like n=1 Tax=Phymastichus coffea TaxID=108790 RepID=UPI00273C806C|nr:zinc finger protein 135-like [Phymastichus coffea]